MGGDGGQVKPSNPLEQDLEAPPATSPLQPLVLSVWEGGEK